MSEQRSCEHGPELTPCALCYLCDPAVLYGPRCSPHRCSCSIPTRTMTRHPPVRRRRLLPARVSQGSRTAANPRDLRRKSLPPAPTRLVGRAVVCRVAGEATVVATAAAARSGASVARRRRRGVVVRRAAIAPVPVVRPAAVVPVALDTPAMRTSSALLRARCVRNWPASRLRAPLADLAWCHTRSWW